MISVQKAINLIKKNIQPVSDEVISTQNSSGRILSKNYKANYYNPPFDISAMDGYACRKKDLKILPVQLKIKGQSIAGKKFDSKINKNEAVRIYTGAKIPLGSDIVIIQENTVKLNDKTIKINKKNNNAFIRKKGLDFKIKDNWKKVGYPIKIKDIALGSAMNISKVKVKRKPIVGIISTGDELVPLGKKTKDFQIVSSSSLSIRSLIEYFGAEVIDLGISKDNQRSLIKKINKIQKIDLLITIGGASVGDRDIVRSSLDDLSFKLIFWKVAIRPGKPIFFGKLNKLPVIGLPGNPVSSYICSLIFVSAAINKLLDRKDSYLNEKVATLGSTLEANDEREDYIRARIIKNKNNQLKIYPYKEQDSSMLSLLSKADCIIKRRPFEEKALPGKSITYIDLI